MKKEIIIILFMLPMSLWASSAGSGDLLTKPFFPMQTAMAEATSALPQGGSAFLENSALLNRARFFEAAVAYEKAILENEYAALYGLTHIAGKPYAVSLAMLIPQSFDEITNEGNTISGQGLGQYIFGLHTGRSFNLFNREILFGIALKGYYESLLGSSAMSFAGDLGMLVPFNFNVLRFFKNRSQYNIHFSFAAKNIGPPIKFEEQSTNLPLAMTYGLHYLILHQRRHKVDLVSSFSYYLYQDTNTDKIVPSFALQYTLFESLYIRGGFLQQSNQMRFSTGLGIEYNYLGNYFINIDYSYLPVSELGAAHQVSLGFSYDFSNFKQKLNLAKKKEQTARVTLNDELVVRVRKSIEQFNLQHGRNPSSLKEAMPFLKKEGFSEVPVPMHGKLVYYPDTGKVIILTKSLSEIKEVIVLKDGSRLEGTILNDGKSDIEIKHKFGTMSVKKSSVNYIFSLTLSDLDKQLLSSMQNYIERFHKQNNRNPANLDELSIFLKQYNVERLPLPATGQYMYDAKTGKIKIIRRFQADPLQQTVQKNGIPDSEEANSDDDIFDFKQYGNTTK